MHKFTKTLIAVGFSALLATPVWAQTAPLPESFFAETADSTFSINYDDLDAVLQASVLSSGLPSRKKATASSAATGTRMKNNSNTLTAASGNRFSFEEYKNNAQMRQIVSNIRNSLQNLPSEAQLSDFSNKEQLAYWLNLYNITVIDEIIQVYPRKNLQDFVVGEDGLLQRKLLKVAGVELSLNDIQFEILQKKFPDQPQIIYGLYQGYIGSPSIRARAYTAANVSRMLNMNANEFINSNRGTYPVGKDGFRVAGFYQRNASYFPNFHQDLKNHLLEYLHEDDKAALEQTAELTANIEDWSITDIYGTTRNFGGGAANNSAALLDAFAQGPDRGPDNNEVANIGLMADTLASRSVTYGRFAPDQALKIKELQLRRANQAGAVTVTDLESDEKKKDENKE
ncbi:DUF547 domain-containing protein [Rheinheimera sp.]|uniref:DUF547 domain-containing protein n=1 Tax=Rheinheimera sp. TaxID=1869214 RepID=UPI0027BADABD|nr:DUF547 domain-containing protein [Rheinheimera sp.]